ncbi:MAG TPA: hypothetical protein VFP84_22750 [Kofleriaceae bacterium]|nr:hypothetical protein [Kofleriaceae bacterium]
MNRAALAACAITVGLAGTAHADKADQLFKKGKRLLADKRYAEACTAFQDSDRLDPSIGAKLNVARCYEEWGKLATAWRWFSDAEHMARDAHDERAKKIRSVIAELDPQIPRITIALPPGTTAAAIALTLDGVRVDPSALAAGQRVDPGPHQIAYNVDGEPRDKLVPVERAGALEVTLDLSPARRTLERDQAGSADDDADKRLARRKRRPSDDADRDDSDDDHARRRDGASVGRNQRILGLTITGAGAVALGVAGIVTLSARSDYHHALDTHCNGNKDQCDPVGQAAADSALHRANVASIVTIGGLAAVAGGLVLYFLAPSGAAHGGEHALYLAPEIGPGHGSFVVGGAF